MREIMTRLRTTLRDWVEGLSPARIAQALALVILSGWYWNSLQDIMMLPETATGFIDVSGQVIAYEDSDGHASIERLLRHDTDGMRRLPDATNFGLTRKAAWVEVPTPATVLASIDKKIWYLSFSRFNIDIAELFVAHADGRIDHVTSDSRTPLEQRPVVATNPVFLLPHDLTPADRLFLKLANSDEFWGFYRFEDEQAHTRSLAWTLSTHGLFAGGILILFIYNLQIYFSTRKKIYLTFSMFLICNALNYITDHGILIALFDSDFILLQKNVIPRYLILAPMFALFFARQYMETKLLYPGVDKFLSMLCWLHFLFFALTFTTDIQDAMVMSLLDVVIVCGISLAVALYAWLKDNPNAISYIKAWSWVIVGGTCYILVVFGLAPANDITINLWPAGLLMQSLMFSRSITESLRRSEDTLNTARRKALEVSQQHAAVLEQRVADTTKTLVEAQKKLVVNEKMAALGVFTAGIAHEINNPANFISGGEQNARHQLTQFRAFIQELLDDEADPDIIKAFDSHFAKLEQSHTLIQDGVHRIQHVVANLRAAHPEGETGMAPANLIETLESTWQMVRPTFKVDTQLVTEFQPLPAITCAIAEINQVFVALLTNAAHAIEDALPSRGEPFRGRITLRTRVDGGYAVIEIIDNGIGMTAKVLDKAFDPFFTTKTVGRGQGLGLSMARDILHRHQGLIDAISSEGEGTRVTLRLPVAP